MAEAALHLMLLLTCLPNGAELPATKLAEFHDLSAGSVSKLMQKLMAAGLVSGSAGRSGGYRLARPAHVISALDIVDSLDGVAPDFHCREIRRDGVCAGVNAQFSPRCSIARVMDAAAMAWRQSLSGVTLAEIAGTSAKTTDQRVQSATIQWVAANSR